MRELTPEEAQFMLDHGLDHLFTDYQKTRTVSIRDFAQVRDLVVSLGYRHARGLSSGCGSCARALAELAQTIITEWLSKPGNKIKLGLYRKKHAVE